MQEESPIPEAVERVAHAVEKTIGSDPPPPPKHGTRDRLKSWASFCTAIAALLAAAGAFLKTCDHSLTENAYNTLSGEITKLSDQSQKDHEDLVKLQGYLDGLARAPVIPVSSASASVVTTMVDAGSPGPVGTLRPLVRQPATTGLQRVDAGSITFAILAPPLPSVQPSSKPVRPPPWAQIEAK